MNRSTNVGKLSLLFFAQTAAFLLVFMPACSNDALKTNLTNSNGGGGDKSGKFSTLSRPLWESIIDSSKRWTDAVIEAIDQDAPSLLNGAADVNEFCPNYQNLASGDRALFWAILLSAVTRHESNFRANLRQHVMGRMDPVTQKPLFREGLLRLAYADMLNHPNCEFDYNQDSRLPDNNLRRTIFIPRNQVRCGVFILAEQVARHRIIASAQYSFWASLRRGETGSRVEEIKSTISRMEICLPEI